MEEWEINKPLGYCCGTDKQIEAGEEYYAALVETEEGLQRRDFCVAYWDEKKPDVYCYWKTMLPLPDSKKAVFVNDEMLLAFFNRLAGETDEEKVNFRFVLMLVLMRKKILKYDSTSLDGDREMWRLRLAGPDKEYVEVVNPHIDEGKIERLSGQIGQILQVNLGQ